MSKILMGLILVALFVISIAALGITVTTDVDNGIPDCVQCDSVCLVVCAETKECTCCNDTANDTKVAISSNGIEADFVISCK